MSDPIQLSYNKENDWDGRALLMMLAGPADESASRIMCQSPTFFCKANRVKWLQNFHLAKLFPCSP